MIQFWKKHQYSILFTLASLLFYASFAYDLQRTDFVKLAGLYVALFYFFYKIIQFEKGNFTFLFISGILFRLVFIVAVPNLSQDFYRFLWDGKLIADGINPYIYTPNQLAQSSFFNLDNYKELLQDMGSLSAGHYSNYPPTNQFFFYISSFFGSKNILGSIVFLRTCIILADVGILYFSKKILNILNLKGHQAFWYFLNPFIIIELTGNLHFEGVMLFFFIAGLYFLLKQRWLVSAMFMALSISVKLFPLMLLPILIRWFVPSYKENKSGWLKLLGYYTVVGLVLLATFVPFISSGLLSKYSETIGLWFQKFEFNASFYYIVREIGYFVKGYNVIGIAGFRMALIVIVFILLMGFLRKNNRPRLLFTSMLFSVCFYLFMATTVHPWYLATPLLLAVFTGYKFPVVWCLTIVLSYFAYSQTDYKESIWLIAIEYLIMYGCFLKEVYLKQPILKHL